MNVSTSDRLLTLLGLFSGDRSEWSVDEAAAELGISVSNTYRYFRSLTAAGLIVPITAGRYVLGPAIIQLDRQMRLRDPLITAATPVLREFVTAAPPDSVAMLCRYFREQVICVHEEFITRPELEVSFDRGLPMPIWRGAPAKVILAHLPLRVIKSIWGKHQREFARYGLGENWTETKASLRRIRNQPSLQTAGELGTPTVGVAAPIFEDGKLIASLGLVTLSRSAEPEIVRTLLDIAHRSAAKLSS